MPSKIILGTDGSVVKEYLLIKEMMTIGRKSNNDIVIDDIAVSSAHATIFTIINDSFIEDKNSTNGISVNGKPTKKHFLQNNDIIKIGNHQLAYLKDQPSHTTAAEFEKTMILRKPLPITAPQSFGENTAIKEESPETCFDVTAKSEKKPTPLSIAALQILNGNSAGAEIELSKVLTTIGKPNFQVATISRRPNGYFLIHVEGEKAPTVCGKAIGATPFQLSDHDVIEMIGIKMEFFFK